MQYRINSVEDQERNGYMTVEHTRLLLCDLFYNWAAANAAAVGSVGWLACSLFLLLCRSLARSLRCSTAKLTCHKNWNCYQLVRAFDVEDYCIKLGWCNGKCIPSLPPCYFSSSRLPRPLNQAATYYMTALPAALPDRPNSRSLFTALTT